jgi:hypothetical protein
MGHTTRTIAVDVPSVDGINLGCDFMYFVCRRIKATNEILSYQEYALAYKSHDPIWEREVMTHLGFYDFAKDSDFRKALYGM